MLIENLGNVTFVNGILRVQCTSVDPEGKVREAGILEIPGASVSVIINGLANASKAIEEKLKEAGSSPESDDKKSNKKKDNKKK
jgi:hypothetical protein